MKKLIPILFLCFYVSVSFLAAEEYSEWEGSWGEEESTFVSDEEAYCDEDEECVGNCYCLCRRYVPYYYNEWNSVDEPRYCKKKCYRYVPKEYEVKYCRYVPEYYTQKYCYYYPECYYEDECVNCKRWYCKKKCKYVPKYYYKRCR